MCLSAVTSTAKKNDRMKVGYKIFAKRYSLRSQQFLYYNQYWNQLRSHRIGNSYHLSDEALKIIGNDCCKYEAGYHMYSKEDEAISACNLHSGYSRGTFIVCEVMCWDIRAYGEYRWRSKCFIARHYRIMGEVY